MVSVTEGSEGNDVGGGVEPQGGGVGGCGVVGGCGGYVVIGG